MLKTIEEDAKTLVDSLRRLCGSPCAKSTLRKGLSETLAFKTWKYLAPVFNSLNTCFGERKATIIQFVSAFYAINQNIEEKHNLGSSFRALAFSLNGAYPKSDEEITKVLENYWRYLDKIFSAPSLKCRCKQLSHFVCMFKSFEIPINYEQLFIDLVFWNKEKEISWANSYYFGEKHVSN